MAPWWLKLITVYSKHAFKKLIAWIKSARGEDSCLLDAQLSLQPKFRARGSRLALQRSDPQLHAVVTYINIMLLNYLVNKHVSTSCSVVWFANY